MSRRGFERYALNERILEQLPKIGYDRPTRVQEKVIPLFLQGKNMVVEAPTGTGKTAAYGLPLISRLNLLKRSTQALVLLPSRELAIQVSKALRSYFSTDLLKVGEIYGGTSLSDSIKTLKSGAHIVVAVPGRLIDVMSHGSFAFFWRDIKTLIIDEGDKLMEMGFQKEFDGIRTKVRKSAQVGFFSATISEDSEALIQERFRNLHILRMDPRYVLQNIRFRMVEVKQGQDARFLAGLIDQQRIRKALIFAGKRERIQSVTGFMRNYGLKVEAYYGSQSQQERENILARFREGYIDFLVASDLAARGLDIVDLPVVINMAIPKELDFYLHRCGRTGRAGNKGAVYNLVGSGADAAYLNNHHRAISISLHELGVKPVKTQDLQIEEEEKWVKFQFSRGKRDKVRKGDIVGFLLNQTDLEIDKVGTITIYDAYSTVDMPLRGYQQLQEKEVLKIKGKSLKVKKFSLDEQEKKAKSVKRMMKDKWEE